MFGERRRCAHCGRSIPEPLTRCRRRTCPGYGALWAGDVRRKLFENLQAYADDAPMGWKPKVLLGAVTAPGVDQLPWDEEHCAALGAHNHSGLLGCRVLRPQAAAFNASASARWRDLHRRAYRLTIRDGFDPPFLVARVFEMQHRGVLHVHPVLGYTTAWDQEGARRYMDWVATFADHYGFGFVERKERVKTARQAAAYLSSYFVKGRRGKLSLEESVRSREMPRSIVHVSHRLTQTPGCTMRGLRMVRLLHTRGWKMAQGDTFHIVDRYEGHPNGTGIRRIREEPCAAP